MRDCSSSWLPVQSQESRSGKSVKRRIASHRDACTPLAEARQEEAPRIGIQVILLANDRYTGAPRKPNIRVSLLANDAVVEEDNARDAIASEAVKAVLHEPPVHVGQQQPQSLPVAVVKTPAAPQQVYALLPCEGCEVIAQRCAFISSDAGAHTRSRGSGCQYCLVRTQG